MNIRCCIVDDEPLARNGIESYATRIPYLTVVGVFSSALDLLADLDKLKPDLLFLDIEMPHLTGLDLIKSLSNPPKVIFTTAFDRYAIEGFELDVIDYLLKPVSFERFLKASEKAKGYFSDSRDSFFLKTDKRMEKVKFDSILYLESMQNYVILHTDEGKHISHTTLKSIYSELPGDGFTQIHKQYIVNNAKIQALEGNQVVLNSGVLPISRTYKEQVMKKLLDKY